VQVVLRFAREAALPLSELDDSVRAIVDAVKAMPDARRAACREDVQSLQRQAAFTLLRRLDRDPLTADERSSLALAAAILAELGELGRAAGTFERAGDDARAAECYGALGDLERMEACLHREEQRRRWRQAMADALRRYDTLMAGGDRCAALAVAAGVPQADFEGVSLRARAREIERRLCRGRGVTLRASGGGSAIRFAALPVTLGRDGGCEVVLRDAGVSRRHASLTLGAEGFMVQDLGSRGGTRLGPAAIRGSIPLRGEGELVLGEQGRLRFRVIPGALELSGAGGMDRGLRAFVGPNPVALGLALPGAQGLALRFADDVCRLERTPGVAVRVDGGYIGGGCDLLHGDVIEVVAAGLRLEVVQ